CQYARAMAEGHPFRYNPGESPSTGSTSLLYTAWLGGADALGIRGEGLVAFAIATGALLFAASVFLARRIGTTLAGEGAGRRAGAGLRGRGRPAGPGAPGGALDRRAPGRGLAAPAGGSAGQCVAGRRAGDHGRARAGPESHGDG